MLQCLPAAERDTAWLLVCDTEKARGVRRNGRRCARLWSLFRVSKPGLSSVDHHIPTRENAMPKQNHHKLLCAAIMVGVLGLPAVTAAQQSQALLGVQTTESPRVTRSINDADRIVLQHSHVRILDNL